jgi:hypothetical protein
MKPTRANLAQEIKFAKLLCGDLSESTLHALKEFLRRHQISVISGDVRYLGGWYITHSGLAKHRGEQ